MSEQKTEGGMFQREVEDEGDFVLRCLPNTYGYYAKYMSRRGAQPHGIDRFDLFIRTEVPMLQFMHDQYYAQKKNPLLQLAALCGDASTLERLDEDILRCIKEKSEANLGRLKDHFIIILENYVLKLVGSITGMASRPTPP
jgi:hypothetical protein